MKIQAVLFDIDGTLVDSNALHVEAWARAFQDAGWPVDPTAIAGQIGKGADQLVPALLPDADEKTAERLGDRHGAIFKRDFIGRVRPFAGARELLARVHDGGRKVVLASSASREELDHYIKLLDAGALIDACTSIDDVASSKPAPDIFATALRKVEVGADAAVVIGDAPYDVAAAKAANIKVVAVRSGGFDDAALAGATAIYDDVAALLADFEDSPIGL